MRRDFWFPPITLPVDHGQSRPPTKLPVLTMTCGYSRWLSAVLAPTRGAEDLFAGWWQLIHRLGAVPRVLVWDGEGAVGRRRHRKTELTQDCQGFRGTLGAKVLICNPADPEAKGIIERNHDYLETSFLPGRSFAGPDDFNRQLSAWIATANTRRKQVLGCAPADRGSAGCAFAAREGHARVPQSYVENGVRLGAWVSVQRQKQESLTHERRTRLESVRGWAWNPQAAQWEEMFRALQKYVADHQTSRVPYSYSIDGCKLGNWVSTQRRQQTRGQLDPERERQLEQLVDWRWNPPTETAR